MKQFSDSKETEDVRNPFPFPALLSRTLMPQFVWQVASTLFNAAAVASWRSSFVALPYV